MNEALMDTCPVMQIGRKRTLHRVRVLIEPPTGSAADQRVVVRSACGLDPLPEGFTETFGLPTCADCEAVR